MGGYPAGEIASALAVAAVKEFLASSPDSFSGLRAEGQEDTLRQLEGACLHANARVLEAAAQHPEWEHMGTTLTLALAADWKLFVAHVGHSRCYLYSKGTFRQLTQDQTIAAGLMREGVLSPADAARHPWRHVVTSILGRRESEVRVELHEIDLQPADILLLCSDGLTEMVPDKHIATILRDEHEPQDACERLVAEANERGGLKNVTVVVGRIEERED
jgi:protein phosphatase